MKRLVFVALLACVLTVACGGGSSSSPTTPTPPVVAANRAPVIATVTATPAFGIASLTVFNFAVQASDPDGDALTYAWNIGGISASGGNPSGTFSGTGGDFTASVTASDGKGASATGSANFILGSMAGGWRVDSGLLNTATFQLTQTTGGQVAGSFAHPNGNGQLDPAQPGSITPAALVTLRVKAANFTDFTMVGTMDTTGRRISGTITGSGFTGQPFSMAKQ